MSLQFTLPSTLNITHELFIGAFKCWWRHCTANLNIRPVLFEKAVAPALDWKGNQDKVDKWLGRHTGVCKVKKKTETVKPGCLNFHFLYSLLPVPTLSLLLSFCIWYFPEYYEMMDFFPPLPAFLWLPDFFCAASPLIIQLADITSSDMSFYVTDHSFVIHWFLQLFWFGLSPCSFLKWQTSYLPQDVSPTFIPRFHLLPLPLFLPFSHSYTALTPTRICNRLVVQPRVTSKLSIMLCDGTSFQAPSQVRYWA